MGSSSRARKTTVPSVAELQASGGRVGPEGSCGVTGPGHMGCCCM